MQKNKDKQASVQLSLFDSFSPEPVREETAKEREITAEPESEPEEIPAELLMEEVPEPVTFNPGKEQEEDLPEIVSIPEEEQKEEPALEIPEESISFPPEVGTSHHRPGITTEDILKPMVIYFDEDDLEESVEKEEENPLSAELPQPAAEETPVPIEQVKEPDEPEEAPEDRPELAPKESYNMVIEEPEATDPAENPSMEVSESLPVILPQTGAGKKVLISGASGFIGGFLVDEALHRGYEVWAAVREGSNRSRLTDERIRFIELTFDNQAILTSQLTEYRKQHDAWDFVIHNAGLTKTLDKKEFFRVNAENTYHFLEALHASNNDPLKFVLMSSLSSFGAGDEKGFEPIGLDDPQRPDTAYGLSKLEAEKYVRRQNYFPYVILRPTGVYGPGDKDYLMEIKSIQSGFDFTVGLTPQRITFIYAKDLATVAFLALESEKARNKQYFVADGDVYTDASFARIIQDILQKKRVFKARIPIGLVYVACLFSEAIGKIIRKSMTLNTDKYKILKQRNWICDIRPLKEDLRFTPAYPLREGLEETIAWYRRHGWLKE